MSAHTFKDATWSGVIHLADIYRFEGYIFEWHHYCGPTLCRKDMEPRQRQPGPRSGFWPALTRWEKLRPAKKEKTRIFG